MKVFFLGAPCSGKTTISRRLAEMRGWHHVATGDIARKLALKDKQTAELLLAGDMAPMEQMDGAVMDHIRNFDSGAPMVIDGYPRYMEQLADVMTLREYLVPLRFVVVVSTNADILERHKARARAGEDEGAFMNRLRYYGTETMRVVNYLRTRHPEVLRFIDGGPHTAIEYNLELLHSWLRYKR